MERKPFLILLLTGLCLGWLCGCQAVNSLTSITQKRGLPAQSEPAEDR